MAKKRKIISTKEVKSVQYDATIVEFEEKQFEVTFDPNQIITCWMICPACNKKLFQVSQVSGTVIRDCRHCKANIIFIFPDL